MAIEQVVAYKTMFALENMNSCWRLDLRCRCCSQAHQMQHDVLFSQTEGPATAVAGRDDRGICLRPYE